MATGTNTGGNWPQRYQITFPDGESFKDGSRRVCVAKYIKDPSKAPEGSEVVTKTSKGGAASHFIAYDYITGVLHGVRYDAKEINGKKMKEVVLLLRDGEVEQELTLGSVKGSFFRDFLKRSLDPNFKPAFTLRIAPYHSVSVNPDNPAKPFDNSGLSMKSGDVKLSAAKYQPATEGKPESGLHLKDMPKVVYTEDAFGEKTGDNTAQITWLKTQFDTLVLPNLPKFEPVATPVQASPPPPTSEPPGNYTQEVRASNPADRVPEAQQTDDLPF